MPQRWIDLTSETFNYLTACWPAGMNKRRQVIWLFLCKCGNLCYHTTAEVKHGNPKSCGCLRIEKLLKHGQAKRGKNTRSYRMWISAHSRATRDHLPFGIAPSDIHIPRKCPLLKITLIHSKGKGSASSNSPTLDRIIPSLGYIKRNVWVISKKANVMKNNSTLLEFERVAKNWRKMHDARKKQKR